MERKPAQDAALPSGPQGTQVSSGETRDTPPPPLFGQEPNIPAPEADDLEEEEGEEDDSFSALLDDKFYHHEAQLRDLYYLQVWLIC